MQISLYIGAKKRKDRIVNEELSKFIEGDRSARIKDLILKGLIFEGNGNIDDTLLDVRYMMGLNVEVKTVKNNKKSYNTNEFQNGSLIDKSSIEITPPDFSEIKIKSSELMNDNELEDRI